MQNNLIVGISGFNLLEEEHHVLQNPRIAGVILFSRNFKDKKQLKNLCAEIHQVKFPQLKIYVDQEGGRVQRFREGFAALPPLGQLGELFLSAPKKALVQAKENGYLMAHELLEIGIDQSFAPVVDLDRDSRVIGDRAFSSDSATVITLATNYIEGMMDAGMHAILKHFPGHGSVAPDTHVAFAVDERPLKAIEQTDLLPFVELIHNPGVLGVMVAHVIYKQIDPVPASLSRYWLDECLRKHLKFSGKIFSDDLGMKAVSTLDTPAQITERALRAGCDYVLLCNEWQAVLSVLGMATH